ncbi:MAG: glucoamylase family protein [Kofleriaceae bacterium]
MPGLPMTDDLPDDALLDELQRAAFGYFVDAVDPATGLVADTSRDHAPASIAVVGFALSTYPVAVERGWMTRTEAAARTLAALRFFARSDQSGGAQATGYKGFYYHFLDRGTGTRVWSSELSMIDTALLIAGVLTASCYFQASTPDERTVRELADLLYRRVDWRWAQDGGDTIRQGWKPECGFLHYGWEGYSEAILLYVLALGSPTHPIVGDCYHAWTSTYQWENQYDHAVLYAGPLFVHQFSHAWLDLRGLQDRFMRDKRSDYFENSRQAVFVQREYARRNPYEFVGYDTSCWGLSAGEGPANAPGSARVGEHWQTAPDRGPRRWFGYAARGVPYGPDDGTLSPSAVLASLPFAPELVVPTVRTMMTRYPEIVTAGRLTSGFNPTHGETVDNQRRAWVSPGHFGLDQGVVVMMIENHRSELSWRLMRDCPYVAPGLRGAGFTGGWL